MAATRRLGEILIDAHLVSPDVVDRAVRSQARSFLPRRLGEVLVEVGALDRRDLVDAMAAQADMPAVNVHREPVDPALLWQIPREMASRLRCLVLRGPRGPRIAIADPSDTRAISFVRRLLGDETAEVVAADELDIAEAIERHYDLSWANARRLEGVDVHERPPTRSPTGLELDGPTMLCRLRAAGLHSVPDFVTALLVHAVEWGADGIDVEGGAVSYLHDGLSTPILEIPRTSSPIIHVALRERAGLFPKALASPAEGRAQITLGDHQYQIRGTAQPGHAGGSLHLDLRDTAPLLASQLGMCAKVEQAWHQMTAGPGLVLLVGSESSGLWRTGGTVRDAIQVNLTDGPTISAAIDAAMDGQTVLGRIFAPSAAEAISLVRELCGDPERLAAALTGVLVQRRIRRVRSVCHLPPESDSGAAERFGVYAFAAPRAGPGCPACRYRGYDGSVPVYELVENDPDLSRTIANRAIVRDLAAEALPVADRTLQVDAVAHAIAGHTTTEELLRILPPSPRVREKQHRGLLRAVTRPGIDDDEEDGDPPTHPAPPSLLVVHSDAVVRSKLRSKLGEQATMRFAGSLIAVRAMLEAGVPDVVVLDTSLLGSWANAPVRALRDLGVRVVLVGPEEQGAALRSTLELSPADHAASVEALISRLSESLPKL
ncbi:hypothetical protein LBMAG42_50990 [Deltaproteobacteria bacterium]|nr:hypothetical protein LBMAG42_50990 [Deltaproteobacteria bacterium]